MNLYDIVKRSDRCLNCEGPPPRVETVRTAAGLMRAVVLEPGSLIRIADAHELSALAVLTADLGWQLLKSSDAGPALSMTLCVKHPTPARLPVDIREERCVDGRSSLQFNWPDPVVLADSFDIEVAPQGEEAVTLLVGPLINMRARLLPLARGRGVEVGPGLRPLVLPGPDVDVTYVEEQDPREWLNLYNKTGDKPELPSEALLARYVRASAVALEGFSPGSIDFVFSNHVFEHLPNPMRVLANWMRALKPGGLIMGVVPDPRFTFDCRQPPTSALDAVREESTAGHAIPLEKYERWCRYTEPRHTPQDLMQRGYSIHVNFFTPESLAETARILVARGQLDRVFVFAAPNHKDFAFALRKSAAA